MIESNIIKRYIVKTFMQNSEGEIEKKAADIMAGLSSRFLLNESVVIPSKQINGKIIKCTKTTYTIQLEDSQTIEVPFNEIRRKYIFDVGDICEFLDCITTTTPLGRIVIENVFERISQPGFGVKKPINQGYPKYNNRTLSRIPERTQIFQDMEYKSPLANFSRKEDKFYPTEYPRTVEESIDIKKLKKLEVEGFNTADLVKLINIHTYFTKFQHFSKIKLDSLFNFAKELLSSTYNSENLMKIHKFLIETIQKDVSSYGVKLIYDFKLVVNRLPEFKAKSLPNTVSKKKVSIDMDNWKSQIKVFIENLSIDCESENVLQFLNFNDENAISTRLDLLVFLIRISYCTDTLKQCIQDSQSLLKSERFNIEYNSYLKNDKTDEEIQQFREQSVSALNNPLRTHIGKYRNYFLILLDQMVVLKDNEDFYILEHSDLNNIIGTIDSYNKLEKSTLMNLKSIIQELIDINKL